MLCFTVEHRTAMCTAMQLLYLLAESYLTVNMLLDTGMDRNGLERAAVAPTSADLRPVALIGRSIM